MQIFQFIQIYRELNLIIVDYQMEFFFFREFLNNERGGIKVFFFLFVFRYMYCKEVKVKFFLRFFLSKCLLEQFKELEKIVYCIGLYKLYVFFKVIWFLFKFEIVLLCFVLKIYRV